MSIILTILFWALAIVTLYRLGKLVLFCGAYINQHLGIGSYGFEDHLPFGFEFLISVIVLMIIEYFIYCIKWLSVL